MTLSRLEIDVLEAVEGVLNVQYSHRPDPDAAQVQWWKIMVEAYRRGGCDEVLKMLEGARAVAEGRRRREALAAG